MTTEAQTRLRFVSEHVAVIAPGRGDVAVWSGFLAWFGVRVVRVLRSRRVGLASAAVVEGRVCGRDVRALVSRTSDTGGARVRLRVLALSLLVLAGCYRSHEVPIPVCESDAECEPDTYCELRFLCVEEPGGVIDCDPFRSGSGCSWFTDDPEGRPYIFCEGDLSTGLGLCAPPEARELWR